MGDWRTKQSAFPAAVLVAAVIVSVPIYPFQWHLLMHVLGAAVFVGNILVTAAWMALAQRTGNRSVLMFAARTVNRADLLFTGPGVVLVLLNGLALAADRWGGWTGFYEQSWIVAALALFGASGAVWVGFLLRYQFAMVRLIDASPPQREVPSEFSDALRRWYAWGVVATLLPLLSLALMVYKPELW